MGGVALAVLLSGCSLPVNLTGSNVPSSATAGSIWRSTDSGAHFEPKVDIGENLKITKSDILSISFLPPDPSLSLEPTTSSRIYAGTVDDGLFRTSNGGELWEHVDFPPKKIYSFTTDYRDPERMFATGMIANQGKIFRTKNGGREWEEKYTEPGTGTVIISLSEHPRQTDVLYAGTSAGTVVKSTDGGDTWRNIGNRVDGPITHIAFDAVSPDAVYLLVLDRQVYYSPNAGQEWRDWTVIKRNEERAPNSSAARAEPSASKTATAMPAIAAPPSPVSLFADPRVSGTIYVGTKAGVFRSRDYGKNWEEVNIIESAKKFPIRALAVNPKNSDEIIFASGRAFYKSVNGGETWAVSELSVDREVSVLKYDPFNERTIFLGIRSFK